MLRWYSGVFCWCSVVFRRSTTFRRCSAVLLMFCILLFLGVPCSVVLCSGVPGFILCLEKQLKFLHYQLKKFNHDCNTLRLFDTLPNLLFTTSETKRDYW